MSEETIGTARIDVVVDTSQLDIAIDRAKNRTASMSTSAQAEYAKLDRAEKRRIDRLIDQANKLNLTKEQQLAYDAALKTHGRLLDEVTGKIRANSQAQVQNGISAKQQAAALRGVPAQLTDIVTSLQGGQKPLTVLLQQGGQLKDMFGGIRPAAAALGGAVMGLINPFTIAAAAGALLIAAWHEGSEEATAYNRALIETGGYAARTAADLRGLAQELDGLAGVTENSAANAITAVVATGRFTGDEFRTISKAVTEWAAATGESVDDVVARFIKLSDDPVKAILELNKSQHFLTEETLKQIESLVEQGSQTEAARVAIETYADVLLDRAPKITQNLGYIEQGWRWVKNSAKEAWDEMLNVGRDPTAEDLKGRIQQWQMDIANLPKNDVAMRAARQAQIRGAQRQLVGMALDSNQAAIQGAGAGTVNTAQHNADKKAQEEWDRLALSNLSKQEKLEREIADIRKKGVAAGKSEADIEAQIANARARYKESLPKGSKGTKTDPTDSIIARLRQQIALNEEQAKSEDKLTATERMMVQVRTELEKLGAKASPQARKLIDNLLAQAKASGENAEKALAEAKAKERLIRLNAQLSQTEQSQQRSIEIDLMGIGRGGAVTDRLRRQLDIHRQYEDGIKELTRQAALERREVSGEEEQALRVSRDRMLDVERDFQARRLAMMSDWRNGAVSAWEDFQTAAADAASQSRDLFTNAFTGAEDALVRFVQTGKLSFTELANSIIADLARIAARQALMAGVQAIGQAFGPNITGFAKGGAFHSPSLSAYSGGVYDQPRLFAFAKGAGVFGEAGPEAIMPLRRGPDGRLGVSAHGQGQAPQVNITVNIDANGNAESKTTGSADQAGRQLGAMIDARVKEVLVQQSRPGGLIHQLGGTR